MVVLLPRPRGPGGGGQVNSPANFRKTLIYARPERDAVHVGYGPESFEEAYGVTAAEIEKALGENWREVPKRDVGEYLQRLREFLTRLQGQRKRDQEAQASRVAP